MKTLIYIVLSILLFSSCITQKRCLRKFHPVPVETKIEYIEKIRIDTIRIKADTLKIVTEVPCENFEIEVENEGLKAKLTVLDRKLKAELLKKPDTIFIQGKDIIKTEYIKEQLPAEKYCPKWIKILAWIGAFWILAIIAYFVLKFRKII